MRIFATFTMLCALAMPARAGVFGGFSADEKSYLQGTDAICRPVPAGLRTAAPSCEKAEADEVAEAKFRKPAPLSGPRAAFEATARGTTLKVESTTGESFEWESVDPIVDVDAVYLSKGAKLLAVELRTRMGSRVTERVIGFHVPDARATRAAASAAKNAADKKIPERSKALEAAIDKGNRRLKRRRWKAAEKAFREALAEAEDPEALYGVAVALARRGKKKAALAEIVKLGASTHPEAVVWKVEARHDKAFRKMLTDKTFRQAVGIDRKPGDTPSAYERLVGPSSKWEQAGVKCEAPRINLTLRRRPQTFQLLLRDTCRGYTDRTKLSGSWSASGAASVELTFPNPSGKDEVFACQLKTCSDSSGEDCLICGAGTDLEMTLRIVRR